MNLKKYMIMGGVALALGMSSCVGDLDLQPNDPNIVPEEEVNNNPAGSLMMCYSGIAVSGYQGPGSSYVTGIDAGTSAYLRMIFTLNEFCTDECMWLWPGDDGKSAGEVISSTWSSTNVYVKGCYYRLMGHIAICNQFLANTADQTSAEAIEMRAEARVLRAYSYYNLIDLYGNASFITEKAEIGELPVQKTRAELFEFVESELKDIVDNKLIAEKPEYGRVGLDGAEALLARLYLNGEVFSGKPRWADCQARCENIIARHQGGGFQGSGLAEHYLYLFARDNNAYMPGGSMADQNEILFGISFDSEMTQSYGGPSFVISATVSNTHYLPRQNYGCASEWSCIRGTLQMAEKFRGAFENDDRCSLWLRGVLPAGENVETGEKWEEENYDDRFLDFTGNWKTCGGNAILKFTGRERNAAADGGWKWTLNENGTYDINFPVTVFASTDQPIIRLADVYLMYTECFINGNVGNGQQALDYMNLIRHRAGAPTATFADLTKRGIMDERSREFYLESTRRTDLVRNGMFAGSSQITWQYKGSQDNNEGTRIPAYYNLYPIPYDVLAAQPDFKQNFGYN